MLHTATYRQDRWWFLFIPPLILTMAKTLDSLLAGRYRDILLQPDQESHHLFSASQAEVLEAGWADTRRQTTREGALESYLKVDFPQATSSTTTHDLTGACEPISRRASFPRYVRLRSQFMQYTP